MKQCDYVTLRELMDAKFDAMDRAIQVALDAQKRHDEWHNGVVEMVRNQGENYITKDMYETRHLELERRIGLNETRSNEIRETMISREEYRRDHGDLGDRIRIVEQQFWKILGGVLVLALLYKYLIK